MLEASDPEELLEYSCPRLHATNSNIGLPPARFQKALCNQFFLGFSETSRHLACFIIFEISIGQFLDTTEDTVCVS